MDYSGIQHTIKQFDQSTLTEFELNDNRFMLHMTKTINNRSSETIKESSLQTNSSEEAKELQKKDGLEKLIRAPLVGIAYLQLTPETAALKKSGDPVKKGEVICIIEAMKLMNEIISDFDGIISEVLIENEAIVEFNQPLFKVSPDYSN